MLTNDYVDRTRGGVELHVYNLSKALLSEGHEVEVLRTDDAEARYSVDGAPVIVLDNPVKRRGRRTADRFRLRRLRFLANYFSRVGFGLRTARRLRRQPEFVTSFDVIHHHDFITSVIIARALRKFGVRQVWTNHLGEFLILRRVPAVGPIVTRWLTKVFDGAIGPSDELAESHAVGCDIRYVPNGVDVDLFRRADKSDVAETLGFGLPAVTCVVPRRWAPTKGVLYAAQALAHRFWPTDVGPVFVGAAESTYPEYAVAVESALESADCDAIVLPTMAPDHMASLLGGADYCVIPSLLEATSLSALEAMAAGAVVIASNVGGLPEIIQDGVTGFLVEPANAEAIARKVRDVNSMSEAERATVRRAARRLVEERFSWREIAGRTSDVLYLGEVR